MASKQIDCDNFVNDNSATKQIFSVLIAWQELEAKCENKSKNRSRALS